MRKITPHLWFDTQAKEAAELYTSVITGSRITRATTLHNTPSGDCDLIWFELAGQPFAAISAGPLFKFNPAISFHIKCGTTEEVDAVWKKLSECGKVLMPLGAYPFSERYGWTEDRFGLSWQVIYVSSGDIKQRITPVLMFVGKVCGKAEEAMNFYASVLNAPPPTVFARYGKAAGPDEEGTVQYAQFTLLGQEFGAMDSARQHDFAFNEAISFMVPCDNQEEIDALWEKLSADPRAEQCGWLRDKYGVSWQIAPAILNELMFSPDQKQVARVTQAFLKMKKLDIAELRRAAASQ
ncbi:MAG TPA: VOC family protein [Terriglobia bacterium]|nr:VOC family protein [Terriglobia bacterium]